MHLEHGRLVRTDMWREGKFLDLWSVPHFLSGMSVALGLYILGFGFQVATAISFFLLVAWEFFEYFADIEEQRLNSLMDVVVGMVSFVPTFLAASYFPLNDVYIAFGAITASDFFLSAFGWRASHKAAVLEQKLLAEFREQKELLRAKRAQINTRMREGRRKWRMRRQRWRAFRASSSREIPEEKT